MSYSALQHASLTNTFVLVPAANLTLTFSYSVDFNLLRKALKTAACCNSTAGASQYVMVLPCNPPYYIPAPFATQSPTNGTCALVQLSPGLPPPMMDTNPPWVQVGLKLLFPKGALYNSVSGPLKEDKEVYVSASDQVPPLCGTEHSCAYSPWLGFMQQQHLVSRCRKPLMMQEAPHDDVYKSAFSVGSKNSF